MLKKITNTLKHWVSAIKRFIKKQDKKTVLTTIILLLIIIVWAIFYFKSNSNVSFLRFWEAGDKKIAEKAVNYINDNDLASATASLLEFSRESGLIKIKIKIGETEFDSYVSKDGRFLFPNVIEMVTLENTNTEGTTPTVSVGSCDELTKTDNPVLEVYIVSLCPYGLQIQRAVAEAVKSVPELANYVKIRYIGSTDGSTIQSMHGEEEATENLRQICIREEQSNKYWNYASCYMKAGDSSACLLSAGVDSGKLSSCMSDTTKGIAYASEDFILNNKYGVSGSPTLMLGDAVVSETGFGGRSADAIKSIVCCASSSESSFCSQALNTSPAATSFSQDYSSGNSTNTANCE